MTGGTGLAGDTPIATSTPGELRAVRNRLIPVGYRITGSWSDAEDAVDEALARLATRPDRAYPENPEAWLVTVTTRLCLDRLRRRRREPYPGTWLPEPIDTALLPDELAVRHADLRMALLIAYERLTPSERAAFVLREAYGMAHPEIAETLEVKPATVRQWVSRARRKLGRDAGEAETPGTSVRAGEPAATDPTATDPADAVDRLLSAILADDLDGVIGALATDVRVVSDGGGKVGVNRNDVVTPRKVGYFLYKIGTTDGAELDFVDLNGQPGVATRIGGKIRVAQLLAGPDGVERVYVFANPDKLRWLTLPDGWA